MIRKLLPLVSSLNKLEFVSSQSSLSSSSSQILVTTSKHCVIVESDHPYKPASVSNLKVTFSSKVKWMSLEFDSRCGTAQNDDVLQIYIKPLDKAATNLIKYDNKSESESASVRSIHITAVDNWPVLRRFTGPSFNGTWPSNALILPGHELVFSFETASDYVKDEKACYFGYKCQVVGYEDPVTFATSFQILELELSFLASTSFASLLSRSLPLLPNDRPFDEESTKKDFLAHKALLGKGLALTHLPTAQEALDGYLPLACEKPFLKDFVNCTPGTSGGRLAAWLQPESYVNPNLCEILCNSFKPTQELQVGSPTCVTIITKDQYGSIINVPNLNVEVFAQPYETSLDKPTKLNEASSQVNPYTGMPCPQNVRYSVTVEDKMLYHAITMMKCYENYSFEELRYLTPTKKRTTELMMVHENNDGTYSANWTPTSAGWYKLNVLIDKVAISTCPTVKVNESSKLNLNLASSQGLTSQDSANKKSQIRKFIGENSAGLRIRVLPSLQSKQIGVIKPGTCISIVDEVHNDDGVWARLNRESIENFCNSTANRVDEAWCMQYHNQCSKNLLFSIEELEMASESASECASKTDKSSLDLPPSNDTPIEGERRDITSGFYHVVKCGPRGHNVRNKPSLRAPSIGVLELGSAICVSKALITLEGTWFKLKKNTKIKYSFNADSEAWTLAEAGSDLIFLKHETEMTQMCENETECEDQYWVTLKPAAICPLKLNREQKSSNDDPISPIDEDTCAYRDDKSSTLGTDQADLELNSGLSQSQSGHSIISQTGSLEKRSKNDSSMLVKVLPGSRIATLQKMILAASSLIKDRSKSIDKNIPELANINVKDMVNVIKSREQSPALSSSSISKLIGNKIKTPSPFKKHFLSLSSANSDHRDVIKKNLTKDISK